MKGIISLLCSIGADHIYTKTSSFESVYSSQRTRSFGGIPVTRLIGIQSAPDSKMDGIQFTQKKEEFRSFEKTFPF